MVSRRQFLKLSAAAGAGLAVPWRLGIQRAFAAQSPQIPLAGSAIPQFIDPLPSLHTIVDSGSQITLNMSEFQSQVLPTGMPQTWVWGYLQEGQAAIPSYIGPVVVATRGIPTEMRFVNNLGSAATTNVQAYKYSTDQTLHWADPLNGEANMFAHMAGIPVFGSAAAQNYDGPIPAVVHLHGGEVPPVLDGGPDAWFTSDGGYTGHAYYSRDGAAPKNYAIYRYPNSQEAAPIWFHDHTLGATRLNVYAGLAGAYLIVDEALNLPPNLPGPAEIIPLVIQDRSFDTAGQLFMPADSAGGILWAPNPEHPYWVPEFVGDTIVVNGKAWPFQNLEAKRYRFLFLNGSNARTYELFLTNPVTKVMGPPMWVIGTDGGYLDTPVKIDPNVKPNDKLVLMPGERYDVIIDFTGYAGQTLLMRNTGRTPYPKGASPQGSTVGRIMQFRIGAPPAAGDGSYDPASGIPLRSGNDAIVRLVDPVAGTLAAGVGAQKTRLLTLNEVMGMPKAAIDPVTGAMTTYPGGPLEVLVNNTKWNGERITGVVDGMYTLEPIPGFTNDGFGNYLSELPIEGETEVWEIVNLTADAHPIHLHLVQFQLMNRQNINVNKYNAAYAGAFPAGYDYVMAANVGPGLFIPAYGPPKSYEPMANQLSGGKYGGNPDITPYLQGPVQPPLPQEAGWKDTVIMYPGQVTRIAVRWAPTELGADIDATQLVYPFDPSAGDHGYVWHCHIIDHEDNEMMRPDRVQAKDAGRSYNLGTDY